MSKKFKTEIEGFTLEGEVVIGDWEGDPSVPGGVNHLPPYAKDLEVSIGDYSHTEDITDEAYFRLEEKFLIEFLKEGE